jgi:hypothetical protein
MKTRKAYAAGLGKKWDVFISHSREDKEAFARPLAKALAASGLSIWFDELTLKNFPNGSELSVKLKIRR